MAGRGWALAPAALALAAHARQAPPTPLHTPPPPCSTALRNLGVGLGHTLLACTSAVRGIGKLDLAAARVAADLDDAWEVLAEPVQTVMRRHGVPEPYEKLKAATRGRAVSRESMADFVAGLGDSVPADALATLEALSPAAYVGNAAAQARALKGVLARGDTRTV